jgi:hypothetical protein
MEVVMAEVPHSLADRAGKAGQEIQAVHNYELAGQHSEGKHCVAKVEERHCRVKAEYMGLAVAMSDMDCRRRDSAL